MTSKEFSEWRKAHKLRSQWYISIGGQVRAEPVTLGEAEILREEFGSIPIHLMHVSQSPDGEWTPLDHDSNSPLRASALWRKEPASDNQKKVLRFFGSPLGKQLTKGSASAMIDHLFLTPGNREKWDAEKDRQQDAAFTGSPGQTQRTQTNTMKTIQRTCCICQQPRPFTKEGPNHILHVILSLVTLGFWLPVWIFLILANCFSPYRCTTCGTAKTL